MQVSIFSREVFEFWCGVKKLKEMDAFKNQSWQYSQVRYASLQALLVRQLDFPAA